METLTPLDPPDQAPEPAAARTRRADQHARNRRTGGRRARRMATRRRAATRTATRLVVRTTAALVVVGLLLMAAVAGGAVLIERRTPGGTSDAAPVPVPGAVEAADRGSVLLVRVPAPTLVAGTASAGAAGITLLSTDPVGGASAIFIPATSLVEIPGVGLDRLGLAQQYGGLPLMVAAVENALGIEVSTAVVVDDRELSRLLGAVGDAEVTLDRRLVERADDGTADVRFEAGAQVLDGVRLAELMTFRERGESELDTFARQQAVLQATLTRAADEQVRDDLLDALPPGADTATVGRVVGALADAATAGEVAYQLLPVTPFGPADQQLGTSYELVSAEVADLISRHVPGAAVAGGAATIPIQVLNGVGVPGVGQRVDRALAGLGVTIVRTDNARTFGEEETRIVIYEESPSMVAVAQDVQVALGVGTIVISRQPQSVVDLTIVVGRDLVAGSDPRTPGA